MKGLILKIGNHLTKIGEKHDIPLLIYNPIIWSFFLLTSRREGKVFAEAIWRVYPQIKSTIDVGSGGGGYVAAMRDKGIECAGYEYAPIGRFLGRLQGVKIHSFDCSSETVISTAIKCDLAFTIEVGEHIPANHADRFVAFLCACSGKIVFSAAHPGQGGHGHINEQTKEFWEKKFINHGYFRSAKEENELHKELVALGYKGWLPVNLQIFSREA